MAAKIKLIDKICNNPSDVRFEDACKVAGWLGFVAKPQKKTSHRKYWRKGEMTQLNFQDVDGKIPSYQAEQLIVMIERYRGEL